MLPAQPNRPIVAAIGRRRRLSYSPVRASNRGTSFMKYTVDEDLKSICDEIAAMKLSPEEWLQHDKKTFWRGSCVCGFNARWPPGAGFHFQVRGPRDLMC